MEMEISENINNNNNNNNTENTNENINENTNQDIKAKSYVGPIMYPRVEVKEIVECFKKSFLLNLSVQYFIPSHWVSFHNSKVLKRIIWGDQEYSPNSDIVCLILHSNSFVPKNILDSKQNLLVTLNFKNKNQNSPFLSKRRNGICSRETLRAQNGIAVVVEKCETTLEVPKTLFSIEEIQIQFYEDVLQIENVKKARIDQKDFRIKKKPITQLFNETELENDEEFDDIFSQESIIFSLSNDPCRSYSLEAIRDSGFQPDSWTSYRFQREVLYLESPLERYEISLNQEGLFRFAIVLEPEIYDISRLLSEKIVPMKNDQINIVEDGLKWSDFRWSESSILIPIQYLKENSKQNLKENSNQNPQKIKIPNIKKVCICSQRIEAVLTFEGNIFAKGKDINSNNPNEFINICELIENTNDRIIEDIVCGYGSIYLLTSKRNVYGIGSNHFGQLGFDSPNKADTPVLMMRSVSKIFSGNCSLSVFVLNSNQELFACGNNSCDQLGLGELKTKSQIQKLTQIGNIPKGKIIDIQCGYMHSIMLIEDEDGKRKLYSCGDYNYNGIGKKDRQNTKKFTEIKSSLFENDNILDFSVGDKHTLILTLNEKLIGFGNNFSGELGIENSLIQSTPIQIELPKLSFNDDISNYHVYCGFSNSFLYYSFFSNLEDDLIKLFRRKEFCDISFKTINGEVIQAHKLILNFRIGTEQNQMEKLQKIISKKTMKEANEIFEIIYSSKTNFFSSLKTEIQREFDMYENITETMKRIYYSEETKDFIIKRNEKLIKFPKLILIMRSELYRGMFLSVTEDKSNQVNDYSELSDEAFEIFEYWIYSNQIKEGIKITKELINEIEQGIDYFQLNESNPNLFDLLIKQFNNEN
ncbi:regulator of chromosome condensation [Anaeramoeba ignava]|uniref:Regulator of chromosome condensation n=1 Tax=Anaeramoeba ignava TaxID=1746090 RepID=A0A9Q0LBA6_ANAIG|nr:regulator of chromosome condensation [Anaeramoeba ignava]